MLEAGLTKEDFDHVLKSASAGTKVRLTFKHNALAEQANLYYLLGMLDQIITMSDISRMTLWAVAKSGKWCGDENRTYTVELLPSFNRDWFEGRLRDCLEKIEVV